MRLWRSLSNQVHERSRRSNISLTLGDEVRDFTGGIVYADFDPAPFESSISLKALQIIHDPRYLTTLVFSESELSFNDIPAAALELLYALLDKVAFSAFLSDGDPTPGAGKTGFKRLAETNSVLVVRGQGNDCIVVCQRCGIANADGIGSLSRW